ncbi:MAG: PQQ-binding-like beta-propeller repeat protein [Acidobacteria bacterium]|jgi:outer membrane protein assembly factor BamB|nr:PQQ-binding-like beta-propeller repeat protein [Acidobacteriota bacterium]
MRLNAAVVTAAVLVSGAGYAEEPAQNWPRFRGPHARGVAEGHATPATWDLESGRGVLWKTPIPGLAHSSPIVWGDSVFVTSAVNTEGGSFLKVGLYGSIDPVPDEPVHRWVVYRIDRKSGEVRWERTAHEGVPRRPRHPKATLANPTPATDGEKVVAFFGSEGLYCYDLEGQLLWKKDFGPLDAAFFVAPDAQWGFASSPIVHDGVVYIQCDVLNDPFLAAFDLETGDEIWRTPRDDVPTWSTPTVHEVGDRKLLLVNGWKHAGGYDATTGKEVWRLSGGGDIPVPGPVVAHDLVFLTNAHGSDSPIYAVRLDAKGDISLGDGETSNDHISWSIPRGGAYMQTPLVYGDYLYNCRDNGVLSVYDAKTGDRKYQQRLGRGGGGFTASPVAADGKVYFTSEDGDVYVVRAGPEYELLATNALDEVTMASPAISEGTLYFRTRTHLVAVGASD